MERPSPQNADSTDRHFTGVTGRELGLWRLRNVKEANVWSMPEPILARKSIAIALATAIIQFVDRSSFLVARRSTLR